MNGVDLGRGESGRHGRRCRRGLRRRVVLRHEHPGAARHLRRDAGVEVRVPRRRQAARRQRAARRDEWNADRPAILAARRCRHVRGRTGAARRHPRERRSSQRRTTAPTVGFSARPSRTSGGGGDTSVVVWDLASPQRPVLQFDVPGLGYDVELSPDGSLLYVGDWDPPAVTVYDVATGRTLRSASVPGAWLEISPDGSLLAAADGKDIVIIDAATLTEVRRLQGHSDVASGDPLLTQRRAARIRLRRSHRHRVGRHHRRTPGAAERALRGGVGCRLQP